MDLVFIIGLGVFVMAAVMAMRIGLKVGGTLGRGTRDILINAVEKSREELRVRHSK